MVLEFDAVYKNGVLQPHQPLALTEDQPVRVTVRDVPASVAPLAESQTNHRDAEMAWIRDNAHSYRGRWLALDGGCLVSVGTNALNVRDEARRLGVENPLMHHVPEEETPFEAFWV